MTTLNEEFCGHDYPCLVCDPPASSKEEIELGIASPRMWRHAPLKPVTAPTVDDGPVCLHCDDRPMCFDCRQKHCAECGVGELKTDYCAPVKEPK